MKKLILIALVVSVILGFGVYSFAIDLEYRFNAETVSIVVALEKIPKSTIIQPNMITVKQFPAEALHELATGNPEDIIGRITLESIEANEPILSTRLIDSSQDNNGLSFSIPQDYRAITIQTDEVSGVAGYINIGDRVDILAVILSGTAVVSQTVEEYLEVVQVSANNSDDAEGQGTAVTVLVPDHDVLKVTYALSEGKYRLALRSVVDSAIDNPTSYSQ
ncbi:Flp pilus assembly protein CpaB [Acetobacterium bakii]|uniref:SAF domain-containing protein n=1 Tax=Acetobacterium bakii TaxID=52689 RepID=A0A0L6TZF9_9FIRM|nr:Flp pilus assembly protein CpaB [Acetobacterium bakii]KNZ41638.1 hypothetical protein AKG39_10590 [Acetobacterium bakii]